VKEQQVGFATPRDLAEVADFQLGQLYVSPSRRLVEGPAGVRHLQPQVFQVFLCLAEHQTKVVTRKALFDLCWAGTVVGDDSLNRALSKVRQMLEHVGDRGLVLETVPRTGYRLLDVTSKETKTSEFRENAVQTAEDCWRLGMPKVDATEIVELEQVLAATGGQARDWGVLALLSRKAAEYADAEHCASYVSRCEIAARRALASGPESHARVALAGLPPLFGNWANTRRQLIDVLADDPEHAPALHDLAICEMATGRPTVAMPLIDRLIQRDPFAATFQYKRLYHLWTLGEVKATDQAAARALQLWPRHPAIWSAWFWILLFTERADQALRTVTEECPPAIPRPAATFLKQTAEAVVTRQTNGDHANVLAHIDRTKEFAATGPAQAVSALLALCALDALDEAFAVARGYYLSEGRTATPPRWTVGGPAITDQHRRVTQPLFIPSARQMREDPRFKSLCEDIGLAAYWHECKVVPDFLQCTTAPPMERE
jgi:DNA-binding winged helix-turn-helix (wHTH) protein